MLLAQQVVALLTSLLDLVLDDIGHLVVGHTALILADARALELFFDVILVFVRRLHSVGSG